MKLGWVSSAGAPFTKTLEEILLFISPIVQASSWPPSFRQLHCTGKLHLCRDRGAGQHHSTGSWCHCSDINTYRRAVRVTTVTRLGLHRFTYAEALHLLSFLLKRIDLSWEAVKGQRRKEKCDQKLKLKCVHRAFTSLSVHQSRLTSTV